MYNVGYIDGCFDLMHSGHMRVLQQARRRCQTLVVGVCSDAEIAAHKHSPPVVSEAERVALLRHVRGVDRVYPMAPYVPTVELLEELGADIYFHGEDMLDDASSAVYDAIVRAERYCTLKRTEGISTTAIISSLMQQQPIPMPAVSSLRFLANVMNDEWDPAAPLHTVVYVQGVFDMLHAGHAQLIEDAAKHGSWLLVGVLTQGGLESFPERLHKIAHCKGVSDVIPITQPTISEEFMKTWGVDLVARGSGHAGRERGVGSADYQHVEGTDRYLQIPSRWPDLCPEIWSKRINSDIANYERRRTMKQQI